jgi:hypothetical protein
MTKTLDKLRGMKLQKGDPIEIKLKDEGHTFDRGEPRVGYFNAILTNKYGKYDSRCTKIEYFTQPGTKFFEFLKDIEEITIVSPKEKLVSQILFNESLGTIENAIPRREKAQIIFDKLHSNMDCKTYSIKN